MNGSGCRLGLRRVWARPLGVFSLTDLSRLCDSRGQAVSTLDGMCSLVLAEAAVNSPVSGFVGSFTRLFVIALSLF
jgi:hypothetical protein